MKFKLLILIVSLFSITLQVKATHLMGGEITYEYSGAGPGGTFYDLKLIVYRYCDNSGGTPAPLDQQMFLGIYVDGIAGQLDWHSTEIFNLTGSTFVTSSQGNSNCSFQPTSCIERGEYLLTILLPDDPSGYHLLVERCCRNGNVINLLNPGAAGMTFYAFIPPGIVNSSPQIADVSVPYICIGDTISIINNAFDPDGDSLVYSFVVPYNGYSNQMDPAPDPQFSNNPYQLPIPDITFAPGHSMALMLGAGGFTSIDPVSGLTKYYFQNQGFYVVAIEIREFRNGVLISATRRDLQFIAIVCPPNNVPVYSNSSGNGGVYSVLEGQQICFNVTFNDPDGDSLYLSATGTLLDASVVNPPGTIANTSGTGTVTSQFCWTTTCGMSRPTPYQFSVTVTDNGCPEKITNQVFSIYVTPVSPTLVPTVSITQSPPGTLCQGSQVSFTATGTLQGLAPQYQWQLNGITTGTNDSIFSPANLINGDIITVTLISNAPCLFADTAYSTPFIVNINSQPAPQVTLTSNPATTLCPQQICLFTANVTNGGVNPSYQWYINGNPSGTNQPLFTAANPAGVMEVYVVVTPSTGCPPQHSDTIIFNIVPTLTPNITLWASATDSICPAQEVMFVANSGNTGTTPIYNWTINGIGTGLNSDTILLSNLQDGDVVNVSVTSAYPCLSPSFTFASPLKFFNYPPLVANLTDGPIEICARIPLELEMTASGGKIASYDYSWSYGNSTSRFNRIIPPYSGYYFATVDDACYDPIIDSIFIEVLPVPVSSFTWSPENPSVFIPYVQFTDLSINAISWMWDLGNQIITNEQNPSHEYTTFGIIPVQLVTTNDVGCTDTLVKLLDVKNFITAYFPNSFTPNGDGINDAFGMIGNESGGYSMSIFNRWGQEVFNSGISYDTWNGTDQNGNKAPAGIYVYIVKLFNDTTQKPYTGTVTLIR